MTQAEFPWLAVYEELGKDWHNLPTLPDKTLSDYIRDYAARFPDREALVFLGKGITYQQLDQLADRFASMLVSLGCQRGDVIGIQLPSTPQYVVAFIAAARLGMPTTSLSPLMTPTEMVYQATDAKVKVILTLEPLWQAVVSHALEQLPGVLHVLVSTPTDLIGGSTLSLTEAQGNARVFALTDQLPSCATELPATSVPLDDVLYLQYTGGTTGMPKGAQLSSRNLFMNNAQADIFYGYRIGQEIVASAFPLFHIGGAAVLFNALRTASTFLLIPDPRNIEHFVAEMTCRAPTVIAAVPALYQMLCQHDGFKRMDFSSLRLAVSGAAPFAREEIAKLAQIIGENKFCEVYGMTETSPVQTINPATRFKPGSVGIPLPGTEVRIVDAETGTGPLTHGEAGEIIISGPQVMKGYLALPQANEKALRQIDGRVWMFTGDIGVMDEEGYVRICDRSKDMLIVGGYKVFSVEVENRIQALDWVAMCAVVGKPDSQRPGNDIVQLYVQRMPDEQRDEMVLREELIRHSREQLSPYKVPKEIFFTDAIPLTSVGKIDKKALRA